MLMLRPVGGDFELDLIIGVMGAATLVILFLVEIVGGV